MVSKKYLGYAIAGIGILFYLVTSPSLASTLGLKLPPALTPNITATITGLIVLVGVILIALGSKKQEVQEVPIYEGKDIVGFRRHKAN